MRDMSVYITGSLETSNVPYVVLVELDFVEGAMYLSNAGYNFDWNGHTWIGLGNLGTISAIEEGQDMQEYGCTLTLSGIPSDYVAKSLGTGYQGRTATIWLAPLTDDYQVLSDPVIVFKGRMDTMPIQLGADAAIQVTVESKLTDWERARVRRYNDADQKAEHSSDRGFEYVALMVEKELVWGRA